MKDEQRIKTQGGEREREPASERASENGEGIYVGIKGKRRAQQGEGREGWEKSGGGGHVGKGGKIEKCPLLNLPTAQMKC